ncbi:hypothetical protein BDR26DRAFT_959120 [Obelidium mucronatum]|nr:hypothetical protein BDR26DRAFT_959120 [Obelidium mucronatum]
MRCAYGCRKQFNRQEDLIRHVQLKHPQAFRQALTSTNVAQQASRSETAEVVVDNEYPIPPPSEINSIVEDDFPDEIPELHARYGIPVNNLVCRNHDAVTIAHVRQQFSDADLDFVQHVILDTPMGQNAISQTLAFNRPRFRPEHIPSFKSGKDLHQRLDSLKQLSVDYNKVKVPLISILRNMPPLYHLQARGYYQKRPCFLYLRSMRALIRIRLQDSSLDGNFAYCFTEQYSSRGDRLYDEAYSGDYCEELQNQLPNGATPLLVILSSDAALATKIGKQSFHPLILDFGNINKSIRKKLNSRSSTLVTYLPIISPLKKSQVNSPFLTAYKRAVIHSALALITFDIKEWIKDGADLVSPDGQMRKFFPCLFNFNGDYPEQTLFSTVSPLCKTFPMPCCFVPGKSLSECKKSCLFWGLKTTEIMKQKFRTSMAKTTLTRVVNSFAANGQVPFVHNAFYDLGRTFCIHSAITPDSMHVIYIGIFGYHLWSVTKMMIKERHGDAGNDRVDSRFALVPTYPKFHHYPKGVCSLSHLTKKDFKSIMLQLLPCIVDLVPSDVTICLRTFLDISMMISNTSHTSASLDSLEEKLVAFDGQLEVFRGRKKMNFPKMHSLSCFLRAIRRFGGPDSFGTEHMEATQQFNVVKAYARTNHKDSEEQMIRHITRIDKVFAIRRLLVEMKWRIQQQVDSKISRVSLWFLVFVAFMHGIWKTIIIGQAPALAGTDLFVGKPLRFFSAAVEGTTNMSFALLQQYQALPTENQNDTGCFILEPFLAATGGFIIVPADAIEARAHMIPYFQDGEEGRSGKVYLNSYAEKYLWSSIACSQDVPDLPDSDIESDS